MGGLTLSELEAERDELLGRLYRLKREIERKRQSRDNQKSTKQV